jgi:hypothetical protein
MNVHEDKTPMDSTKHGGKLAAKGKSGMKKFVNKKADRFRKSQAKRG